MSSKEDLLSFKIPTVIKCKYAEFIRIYKQEHPDDIRIRNRKDNTIQLWEYWVIHGCKTFGLEGFIKKQDKTYKEHTGKWEKTLSVLFYKEQQKSPQPVKARG